MWVGGLVLDIVPSRRQPSALSLGSEFSSFSRKRLYAVVNDGNHQLFRAACYDDNKCIARSFGRPVSARSLADLAHTPYPQNSGRWVSGLATLGRALDHTQGQARTYPLGLMMAGWASAERAFVCSSTLVSKLRTASSTRPQRLLASA